MELTDFQNGIVIGMMAGAYIAAVIPLVVSDIRNRVLNNR